MMHYTDADVRKNSQLLDFLDIITLLTGDIVDIPHKVNAIGRYSHTGGTAPEQHAGIEGELPLVSLLLQAQAPEGQLIAHPKIRLQAVGIHLHLKLTVIIRHHQIRITLLMKDRSICIHDIVSILTHIETSQTPLEYLTAVGHLEILLVVGSDTGQRGERLAIGGDFRDTGRTEVETGGDTELLLIVEGEEIYQHLAVKHLPLTRHGDLILHQITLLLEHQVLDIHKVIVIFAHKDLPIQMFLHQRGHNGDTGTQAEILTERRSSLNADTRCTDGVQQIQMLKGATPVERLVILLRLQRRHILCTTGSYAQYQHQKQSTSLHINYLFSVLFHLPAAIPLYHRHHDLLVGGVAETKHQKHVGELLHRIGDGIRDTHLQYATVLLFLLRHELTQVVEHLTAVGRVGREHQSGAVARERTLIQALVELLVLTMDQVVVVALRRQGGKLFSADAAATGSN